MTVSLGLWLLAAPLLLGHGAREPMWNDLVVGALVVVCGVVERRVPAVRWLAAALGAWLVLAPFTLDYEASLAMANDLLLGGVLLGVSIVSDVRGEDVHRPPRTIT